MPICFFLNSGEKYFLVNHFSIIMECSYTFFVLYTLYLNPLRSCLTTAMEFKITLMILPWFLCTIGWLLLRWWSTIHILTAFHFLNERQPIILFFIEISEINETHNLQTYFKRNSSQLEYTITSIFLIKLV